MFRALCFVGLSLLAGCKNSKDSGEPPEPPGYCQELELAEQAFSQGPYGSDFGDVVADFTLTTLGGQWSLQSEWTGCDTYVFFNYHPDYEYAQQVWGSDVNEWLDSSPQNVHYFFTSYAAGQEETHVSLLSDRVELALAAREADDAAFWRERIHYVTDSPVGDGPLAEALSSRMSWAIAIDRAQRFREIGYLSKPDQTGVWEASLRSLTFEARYFNHEVQKQAFIDGLNATAVTVFEESMSSAYAEVTLPSASEMAAYDSLHLDLSLGCGDPFTENCGEWDYLVHAYICSDPAEENPYATTSCQPYVPAVAGACYADEVATEVSCSEAADCEDDSGVVWTCEGYVPAVDADTQSCSCDEPTGAVSESTYSCNAEGTGYGECACDCGTELGRWVTSYARNGRWVTDASPLLALLKDGGTRRLRFSSAYTYENNLTLLLSNSGAGTGTPQIIVPLFTGGSFNENYNSNYEPVDVEIPADVTRVELVAVISGHGWGAEEENCAEFCNHTHHMNVNGTEYVKEHPIAGVFEGCVDQIEEGTVPNQYGTWPYGRGGWCPGKQVGPWIEDVTEAITPGSTATLSYRGLFEGEDYVPEASSSGQGFGAQIRMVSYVVMYQ